MWLSRFTTNTGPHFYAPPCRCWFDPRRNWSRKLFWWTILVAKVRTVFFLISFSSCTRTCLKVCAPRFCFKVCAHSHIIGGLIDWLGTPCLHFSILFLHCRIFEGETGWLFEGAHEKSPSSACAETGRPHQVSPWNNLRVRCCGIFAVGCSRVCFKTNELGILTP